MTAALAGVPPPLGEALRFWLKLGFVSFGGPAGQIAVMHRELVERRRWIPEASFLHALNFCMLLPGPEAQQLATYVGWLLHGTLGGLAAGALFVLPGALLMLLLSWTYAAHGDVAWVAALFYGLRAAVVAIVVLAVMRIGRRALKSRTALMLAAAAFLAIALGRVPFPLMVLAAGGAGLLLLRADAELRPEAGLRPAPSKARSLRVLLTGLLVWGVPLAAIVAWRGQSDVLSQQAAFFSKAAMVTFGGAYAVLAYVDQAAVQDYGWLLPGQMLDGLGLAETTPGPLILVLQFVGYLGAARHAADLSPQIAGLLGAGVALWATFAPCFLWIFLGAPYVERLRGEARLSAALSGVTAAVVGVILSLALRLGLHALFGQVGEARLAGLAFPRVQPADFDPLALTIGLVAFFGMQRRAWGIVPVTLGAALAGLLRLWLGG